MSRSSPLFPLRRSPTAASPARSRRHRRGPVDCRLERLEVRHPLAVTATLVGDVLQISLGAADDVAYLSNDGTNYVVRGTNLSGQSVSLASVSSVEVAGTAAANQAFTVAAGVGAVLVDPLNVAASVESTTIVGQVNLAGDLLVDSASITLAADVTTTGQQRYKGAVGLSGNRLLAAGSGNVTFEGTVDSSPLIFADPDSYAAGADISTKFAGMTLSVIDLTTSTSEPVDSVAGQTSAPAAYAPTGNRVFGADSGSNREAWAYNQNTLSPPPTGRLLRVDFDPAAAVLNVSFDFTPWDDLGAALASPIVFAYGDTSEPPFETQPPTPVFVPYQQSATVGVTQTLSPRPIIRAEASWWSDAESIPSLGSSGMIDNLRATLWTTPQVSLTVNTSGQTTFKGDVGGIAKLSSLVTDAAGGTTIEARAITTAAAQTFNDAVTVAADVTLTGVAISLAGAVDASAGTEQLSIADTGLTTFGGLVGGTTPLGSLTTAASGTVLISAGSIKTAGSQSYGGQVSLGAATTLVGESGTLAGGVLGNDKALTLTFTKLTTIDGTNFSGLASLASDGGGDTVLSGTITTSGSQTYSDAVTLSANTVVDGSDIEFASTVDGGFELEIRDSATTRLGGAVGGLQPLVSLVTTAGGTTTLAGGPITTTGAAGQVYGDAVTLGNNTTLDAAAGPITFTGGVTGAFSLAANSTGSTTFGGPVSIKSLATNAGGTTAIDGGAITTTDAAGQVYGDAVTLGNNTTLDAGTGAITFASTVNGTTAGQQSLTLAAGGGNITMTGGVGGTTRLGAITIASAANVTANAITAAAVAQAAGSGTTTLNGEVDTNTSAGVSLSGTNVVVNARIVTTSDGAVTLNQSATATIAAAGEILADGPVSLTAGGGITTAGDVTTTNDDVTFVSATTLSGPIAIGTGAGVGNIRFSGTLDGAQTLSLAAGAGNLQFAAAVGSVTPLAGIAISSAASTTADSTVTLDGTPNPAADGLAIGKGVNSVSITAAGSEIRNFKHGLVFAGGSTGSTVSGFTISDNSAHGVVVGAGGYASSVIADNTITGNGDHGIVLAAGGGAVTGLTLGGAVTAGAGNQVTGNGASGILIESGDYSGTSLQGNEISDNQADGVYLDAATLVPGSITTLVVNAVTNLVIGGSTSLANTISGNAINGIHAALGDYSGTVIAGNTIADNGDPTTHVGDGILILGARILVGDAAGSAVANPAANTISGNAANGIRIVGPQANRNAILSNNIFLNGYVDGSQVIGEGIALENGANDSAVAPTVLSAARRGTIVFVNVFVPGPGLFTLQVFTNTAADSRGLSPADVNGFEGRTPVAGITVVGQTNTVVEVPANLVDNDAWITAATTQLDGVTPTNTSPFSTGNRLVLAPATVPTGTAVAHGRGIAALPGARLYSAKTGNILVNVGDTSSPPPSVATASVADDNDPLSRRTDVQLTAVYSPRFASGFLGGVQVATADVDQDGFDDLITVPAGVPAWMSPQAAAQYRRTFASDLTKVGIFSGNPDGVWRSAWFSAGGIPSLKSGTLHVTAVNLEGSTLPEIVLAGGAQQTGVAAFQNQAAPGARPNFSTTPVNRVAGIAGVVTGLTGGVFSAAGGRVVVASRAPAGTRLTVLQPSAGNAFARQATYAAKAAFTPGGKIAAADIFRAGATLAVGDFDGGDDANEYVDLVVGAGPGGWSNFRVVKGDKLLSGSQAVIDRELRGWGDFGAPRAFGAEADPYSSNGRLTLRAADTDEDAKAEVFASIGSSNQTSLLVNAATVRNGVSTQGDVLRRLVFTPPSSASQPPEWTPLENTFVVAQSSVPRKGTRFTVRNGVNLG